MEAIPWCLAYVSLSPRDKITTCSFYKITIMFLIQTMGFIPLRYAICTNLIPPCWPPERWSKDPILYPVLYAVVLEAVLCKPV